MGHVKLHLDTQRDRQTDRHGDLFQVAHSSLLSAFKARARAGGTGENKELELCWDGICYFRILFMKLIRKQRESRNSASLLCVHSDCIQTPFFAWKAPTAQLRFIQIQPLHPSQSEPIHFGFLYKKVPVVYIGLLCEYRLSAINRIFIKVLSLQVILM